MSTNNVSAVSDALKYVNGVQVVEKETNITEGIKNSIFSPTTAIFGIFQSKGALKDAYLKSDHYQTSELYKTITKNTNVIKEAKEAQETAFKAIEEAKKAGKNAEEIAKLTEEYKSAKNEYKELTSIGKKIKSFFNPSLKANTKTSASTLDVLKGIKADSALTGAGVNVDKSITSQFNTVLAENEAKYLEGVQKTAEGTGKISAVKRGVKSLVSKAASHLPKGLTEALSKFGQTKIAKVFKGSGAGSFAFIEGGIELITSVVPAFKQGGASAGFKQIGKSAAKVTGSCLGWAGGATVGKTAGAFLGSFFGPVGTLVGGAVGGFLGGMIGSSLLSGVAEKITGKSEVEKLQDEQYNEAAGELAQDAASMQEVKQLVEAKVQEDIQTGNVTEDTEKMAQYLEQGAFGSSAQPQSYQSAYAPNVNQYSSNANYSTNNINQYSNLNDAAAKIAAGDTSIYNVSDEKLNSLFSTPASSKSSTNIANSSDLAFKGNKDVVNYYA